MKYDLTAMPGKYIKGRQLPQDTLDLWMSAISQTISKRVISQILDIGCGTGRFSQSLSNHFSAKVIGIDPSEKMLSQAIKNNSSSNVQFQKGRVEDIPLLENKCDLIFMSQVFHHINNIKIAKVQLLRMLKKNRYFAIRNSTIENQSGLFYNKFFPTAMKACEGYIPTRKNVIDMISDTYFELVEIKTIEQMTSNNILNYYEKIKNRVYSDLTLISDQEFEIGLKKMKETIDLKDSLPILEPLDLFIFKKIT